MKDSDKIPDDEHTTYMKIDEKEYQSRTNALPGIKAIISEE